MHNNTASSVLPLRLGVLLLPLLLLLLLRVEMVRPWTAIGFYHNEAHPGRCFISELLILAPGQTAKLPAECAEITCSRGDNGQADIRGCGSVAPPPDCEWGDYANVDAPYPQCCLREVHCANAENLTAAQLYQNQVRELFGIEVADARAAQPAAGVAERLTLFDTNKI